jgi:hypothetical protein
MTTETPRDSAGAPLCAWCGGRVPPSRGTKPRAYCKDGCKQRAYEARRLEKQLQAVREQEAEKRAALLVKAYAKGRREATAEVRATSSRDDGRSWTGKSRDFPSKPQVGAGAGEECPYCREAVVGLVAHLRQCPEGPAGA